MAPIWSMASWMPKPSPVPTGLVACDSRVSLAGLRMPLPTRSRIMSRATACQTPVSDSMGTKASMP